MSLSTGRTYRKDVVSRTYTPEAVHFHLTLFISDYTCGLRDPGRDVGGVLVRSKLQPRVVH